MLAEEAVLSDLIARIRRGDEQAAAELVRVYEPQVRRLIRVRLTDPQLKRQFESIDICQSVMASFFARIALGQYDFDSTDALIKLLATMARNKLVNRAKHHRAKCRDVRRMDAAGQEAVVNLAGGPRPSQIAVGHELLDRIRSRLTDEERYVVEQRAIGRTWLELSQELGQSADGLRMRISRRLDLLAEELGIDDSQQ